MKTNWLPMVGLTALIGLIIMFAFGDSVVWVLGAVFFIGAIVSAIYFGIKGRVRPSNQ